MASRYIDNSAYAVSGYTLSGVFQSITIGSKGSIGGPGLVGGTAAAYTIVNRGRVSGSGNAISLQHGGSISNGAGALVDGGSDGVSILGNSPFGNATVSNSGTIAGGSKFGVYVDGGSISNAARAVIKGAAGVGSNGDTLSVGNNGTIIATGASDNAIQFAAGTVHNAGVISATGAYSLGVFVAYSGFVANGAGAVIEGVGVGLSIEYAGDGSVFPPSSVNNGGTIEATGAAGVGLESFSGGKVSNAAGALIAGANAGVVMERASGTITNAGRIIASGGYRGTDTGVYLQTGLVENSGTAAVIEGLLVGVELGKYSSGTVENLGATALIAGGIGVDLTTNGHYGASTVVNAGTIASTAGASGVAIQFAASDDILIDEAGAHFTGTVVGGGGTLELAGATGTLSGLGTSFSGFGTVDLVMGADWVVSGADAVSGVFNVSGTLDLLGTVSGAGTLTLAGSETIASGAKLTLSHLAITAGTATLGANLAYSGSFTQSGGSLVLGSHILTLKDGASFATGGTIGGAGNLQTDGTSSLTGVTLAAHGGVTLDGGVVWQDFGTVTDTGNFTLGDNSATSGRLVVEAGGTFDIAGDVLGFSDGSSSIANAGLFEKTAGSGYSQIQAPMTNDGTILVTAGALELSGGTSGTGTSTIGSAGTLWFDRGVASTQTVHFASTSGGKLYLGNPIAFAGTISGFAGSDGIVFGGFDDVGTAPPSWTQDGSSGKLTVVEGSSHATIALFGQYTSANFMASSGPGTSTLITYVPTGGQVAQLGRPHH